MNSKITIITPSFNQVKYIEQTITSVLDQNYSNLEYIIIDGGSTDGTIDIIKKYEKYLAYWISELDNGQAHAINKGLKKATGEIFNWLNSDDYLENNALNIVAEHFQKEKDIDILCGNCRVFEHESNSTRQIYRMKVGKHPDDSMLNRHINQPSTFYRLDKVKKLGSLNESLNFVFDAELWFKYLAKYGQEKVVLIDDVLSNFRIHATSKTGINEFEPFYDEEKNIHLYLAQKMNLPEYLCREIFEDIASYHYKTKDWEINQLNANFFKTYFSKKFYKNLYYKQKYIDAKECIKTLDNGGNVVNNTIKKITCFLPANSITLFRDIKNKNHYYLKHNLNKQVNLRFRSKSKLLNFIPRKSRVNTTTPIIINNRNRLEFMLKLIEWLEKNNLNNIYIIDNNSGYSPLLDYYRKTKHKVFHLNANAGHLALWNSHIYERFKKDYYIYTDPDILPLETCPDNILDYFSELLNKYNDVQKVGFGLKIDDLPDTYINKQKVIDWEKQYWTNERELNVFEAKIDTTFAIYRPGAKGGHRTKALRTGGKYVARHLPWYVDSAHLSMEEKYYITHSSGSSSWYHRNNIYE